MNASGTGSRALLDRAARVIPGGINTCKRKIDPPFCVRRASGAYLEDVDGRRYIDFHAGYGAVFAGHAHPEVNARVAARVGDVVLAGVGVTDVEVAVAESVVRLVPSVEQVLACNSGSEATLHALRLARAITGRQRIIKFQGCYDGFHDSVLMNILSTPDGVGHLDLHSAGMLDGAVDSTVVCRFNDLDDVASALAAHQDAIAAIIVEPIPHTAPSILPRPGFLEGLRRLCDEHGALLIFDEVVTGFRHGLGGYQAICGVAPDLTTLGKAVANGYPLGLVGGPEQLMAHFNTTASGDVYFGGTFNGNSPALAAAEGTIAVLERPGTYERVYALGDRMRAGLQTIVDWLGIVATVTGFGSLYGLVFVEGPIVSYEDVVANDADLARRYRRELIARGIFEIPEPLARNHISVSHIADDIDRALEASEAALQAAVASSPTLRA